MLVINYILFVSGALCYLTQTNLSLSVSIAPNYVVLVEGGCVVTRFKWQDKVPDNIFDFLCPPPKPMLTCLERYDTIVHSNTQFSQWALCRWKPDAWKGTSWNGAGLATLTLERHAPCSVPRWFVEGQKPPQCTGRYLLVLAEPKSWLPLLGWEQQSHSWWW